MVERGSSEDEGKPLPNHRGRFKLGQDSSDTDSSSVDSIVMKRDVKRKLHGYSDSDDGKDSDSSREGMSDSDDEGVMESKPLLSQTAAMADTGSAVSALTASQSSSARGKMLSTGSLNPNRVTTPMWPAGSTGASTPTGTASPSRRRRQDQTVKPPNESAEAAALAELEHRKFVPAAKTPMSPLAAAKTPAGAMGGAGGSTKKL